MCKVIVLGTFISALGVVQALGKKKKYYLIAIGKSGRKNLVKWSKYLNEMVYLSEEEGQIEILQKNKDNWRDAYIIPTSDSGIKLLCKNFEALSDNYTILVDRENISNILDKMRFIEICESIQVPCPKSYTRYNNIDYPVIVKPEVRAREKFRNTFGKFILIVNGKNQLDSVREKSPEGIMIQQYIPGGEVFLTGGYCYKGETRTIVVVKKVIQRPPFGGDGVVHRSAYNSRLIQYSKKILEKIQYSGIFDMEFVYKASQKDFYFIEMSPRAFKWIGFAESLAPSIIEQSINLSQAAKERHVRDGYEKDKVWVDIHGAIANLVQYPSTWKSVFKYIYYLVTADYFAVLDKDDMSPFLRRR